MANLTWTSEALRCLHDIYEYIAVDNRRAAASVVRGSCAKAEILRQHPHRGQRCERIVDRDVYEVSYGHYRIAYLIANGPRVVVLGVFHSGMEIDRHLT